MTQFDIFDKYTWVDAVSFYETTLHGQAVREQLQALGLTNS
jgi:hypothetical protein